MTNPKQRDTWGSHVPVVRALLETYNITGAIEFGMGLNSTPTFHKHCEKVLSVENDLEWIKECNITETETKKVIHHDVAPVVRASRSWDIDSSWIQKQEEYFEEYKQYKTDYQLVFIDQYSSLRSICAQVLHDQFEFAVLHDVEKISGNKHGLYLHYTTFEPNSDLNIYIDKTTRVQVGLLTKHKLSNDFMEAHRRHWKQWNQKSVTKLELDNHHYINR